MTIPKIATVDPHLPYTTWRSDGTIFHHCRAIKAGSHVIIDSPACQRNPHFWDKADEFRPERHLEVGVRDRFTGFSSGARQCIGKRLAEVEMVGLISHVVREYRVRPVHLPGEGWKGMRERVLRCSEELSLTPGEFDLELEKRV